jgi:hypothetical protein
VADITLLHFNIKNFSLLKANDKVNGAALINYIAWVVAKSNANIVSILEIFWSAADDIINKLTRAIDIAKGDDPENSQWKVMKISSGKRGEAYVVFYQLGNNFKPAETNGERIGALTASDSEGANLRFNSRMGKTGGRKPYYVAFETTDTDKKFTVIALHVMFSKKWSRIGVESSGLIAENKQIELGRVDVALDASLTAADFNVDFNSIDTRDSYDNLKNMPSIEATRENTTLLSKLTKPAPLLSSAYRVNAYDNIFRYKATDPPADVDGTVFDLIKDSTTKPTGTAELVKQVEAFKAAGFKVPAAIQHIPPRDFADAWRIVNEAISDHLPVYVSLTV